MNENEAHEESSGDGGDVADRRELRRRERQRERARERRTRELEREEGRRIRSTRLYRASIAIIGLIAVGTILGMFLLRPGPPGEEVDAVRKMVATTTYTATVNAVEEVRCKFGDERCIEIRARMHEGPDRGDIIRIQTSPQSLPLEVTAGDRVRLIPLGDAATAAGEYAFADFDRTGTLAILLSMFVVAIALLSGLRGLRAVLGLVLSLFVVVQFMVPAMLAGRPIYAVALVGSLAVMLSTIVLSHGFGLKAIAAVLGASGALTLTMGLGWIFVEMGHLSGFTSEEATLLQQGGLSLRGLLLAGMIIGTMGVLDDVTVSQASTVLALRRADPTMSFRRLFRSALAVGHDHIAATVNTLVLAYAGSSLAVLIILSVGRTNFLDAINNEVVAQEVVSMLVGSIGLVAAVPLTTALAAALATRTDPSAISAAEAHGHSHG